MIKAGGTSWSGFRNGVNVLRITCDKVSAMNDCFHILEEATVAEGGSQELYIAEEGLTFPHHFSAPKPEAFP